MIAEKKRKLKKTIPDEPKNRFYVRKWNATSDEMSEIRNYVRAKKSKNSYESSSINKNKAKKIREKLVR